jgi:hypothetical protein
MVCWFASVTSQLKQPDVLISSTRRIDNPSRSGSNFHAETLVDSRSISRSTFLEIQRPPAPTATNTAGARHDKFSSNKNDRRGGLGLSKIAQIDEISFASGRGWTKGRLTSPIREASINEASESQLSLSRSEVGGRRVVSK